MFKEEKKRDKFLVKTGEKIELVRTEDIALFYYSKPFTTIITMKKHVVFLEAIENVFLQVIVIPINTNNTLRIKICFLYNLKGS